MPGWGFDIQKITLKQEQRKPFESQINDPARSYRERSLKTLENQKATKTIGGS